MGGDFIKTVEQEGRANRLIDKRSGFQSILRRVSYSNFMPGRLQQQGVRPLETKRPSRHTDELSFCANTGAKLGFQWSDVDVTVQV
jgi:hypothetical protein